MHASSGDSDLVDANAELSERIERLHAETTRLADFLVTAGVRPLHAGDGHVQVEKLQEHG